MPKKTILRFGVPSLIALFLVNTVYPIVWIGLPIHAVVVDGDSRKPIEGAIVVASWTLGTISQYPIRQIAVYEGETDASGQFNFPGWGPVFKLLPGGLAYNQPIVHIFKFGYKPMILNNVNLNESIPGPYLFSYTTTAPTIIRFRLNGKTIALSRITESPADQANDLNQLDLSMISATELSTCGLGSAPKMFSELVRAKRYYLTLDPPVQTSISNIRFKVGSRTCPAVPFYLAGP